MLNEPASDAALSLAERAYRSLRQAIGRCELELGARLRVEELSQRFAVSSSPLREALNRLSEQGLVRDADKALALLGEHIGRTAQLIAAVLAGPGAAALQLPRRGRPGPVSRSRPWRPGPAHAHAAHRAAPGSGRPARA